MRERSSPMGVLACVALTLASCSGGSEQRVPLSPQQKHAAQCVNLRQRYEAARSNAFQLETIESEAKAFFEQRTPVDGWTGTVSGVSTGLFGSAWVNVRAAGVTFALWVENGAAVPPLFRELREGDRVRFSGTLRSEMSLTMAGAMRAPEFRVDLASLARE